MWKPFDELLTVDATTRVRGPEYVSGGEVDGQYDGGCGDVRLIWVREGNGRFLVEKQRAEVLVLETVEEVVA